MAEEVGICNQCGFDWRGVSPPFHICDPSRYPDNRGYHMLCEGVADLEQVVKELKEAGYKITTGGCFFGKTEPQEKE